MRVLGRPLPDPRSAGMMSGAFYALSTVIAALVGVGGYFLGCELLLLASAPFVLCGVLGTWIWIGASLYRWLMKTAHRPFRGSRRPKE